MTEAEKREMLELAAMAAGMDHLIWTTGASPLVPPEHRSVADRCCWNPSADDGDCARLEAALDINVQWLVFGVLAQRCVIPVELAPFDAHGGDRNAARRAASVAVAAEIGRQMQSAEGAKERVSQ